MLADLELRCHVLFERQKAPNNVLPVQEIVYHYSGSRALKISEPQFLMKLASFIGKKKLFHCILLGIHKTDK